MVKVTSLPLAPDIVSGIIDLHGTVIPVYDPRVRFNLPKKSFSAFDSLIIANNGENIVGLAVEKIEGVVSLNQSIEKVDTSISGTNAIEGVVRIDSGLVVIYDLSLFITPIEAEEVKKVITDWKVKNQV